MKSPSAERPYCPLKFMSAASSAIWQCLAGLMCFASSSFTSLENDMSGSFSGYITVVQLDTVMTFRLHTFVQFIC